MSGRTYVFVSQYIVVFVCILLKPWIVETQALVYKKERFAYCRRRML